MRAHLATIEIVAYIELFYILDISERVNLINDKRTILSKITDKAIDKTISY